MIQVERITTFLRINRWLFAGIVAIGLATWISVRYVHQVIRQDVAKTQIPTIAVLVATQPISAYTPITPNLVKTVMFPASAIPTGAFQNVQSLTGAWTMEAISPGMPLVQSAVFFPKSANIIAARIAPGDMAIDVPLNATSAVDGLIQPGDTVALFISTTKPNGDKVIADFLNHLKVLAVNGSLTPSATSTVGQGLNLIVALSPAQVEALVYAEQNATAMTAALESPHSRAIPPQPYDQSQFETLTP
ncbi:Flp pilus assembly protein CpaB [Sulfobacillus acidophilus DSM 10332]|uniref:Flp pilus assembly protein CpaB n=1 Tax=Sulfobacillus acidophilus (strain ATCC 700253 / DSM 10332 / NAL) TaxID=679936 RepID=G8U191_SULAD|nr:Flp pilus assembly protein CpaB [Sulfobacillus acidophilus DSM 10332]